KAPLPADPDRALRALLDGRDQDAAEQAQRLLDAHCLIGVSVNPESRVKAARGPAEARLRPGRGTGVLVQGHKQAGGTPGPPGAGPQLRAGGEDADGRWLEAAVQTDRPREPALSGRRLEYVVLRLTAREAGKREATLKFDVGQGTQDLGFRAEVPVLFTVLPAERRNRAPVSG